MMDHKTKIVYLSAEHFLKMVSLIMFGSIWELHQMGKAILNIEKKQNTVTTTLILQGHFTLLNKITEVEKFYLRFFCFWTFHYQ